MNAFFTRRLKRATTWLALLVWLFALSAGVANACLLEVDGTHGQAPRHDVAADRASKVSAGRQVVTEHNTGDETTTAPSAPCLKVCEEAPQSPVTQGTSAPFDGPVLLTIPWSPLPSLDDASARQVTPADMLPPGPPARVRFSRLAL